MDSIGPLITATRNGALEKAPIYNAAGKICKKMDRQMYKSVVEAVNASQKPLRKPTGEKLSLWVSGSRIGVYGATSTPIDQLAKAIRIY